LKGNSLWLIEDERHAEPCGEFMTRQDAMAELQRRADLPWDAQPNVAPCMSWRTCGRFYELIEFDGAFEVYQEKSRVLVLSVTATGAHWHLP
jgi:hypothetical protein